MFMSTIPIHGHTDMDNDHSPFSLKLNCWICLFCRVLSMVHLRKVGSLDSWLQNCWGLKFFIVHSGNMFQLLVPLSLSALLMPGLFPCIGLLSIFVIYTGNCQYPIALGPEWQLSGWVGLLWTHQSYTLSWITQNFLPGLTSQTRIVASHTWSHIRNATYLFDILTHLDI